MAADILGAAGLGVGRGADHVILVDAGPWGEAWSVIFSHDRGDLVRVLRSWGQPDPTRLWESLRNEGRPADIVRRVAAWLWLQGRSASCTPVWWEEGALVMADKPGKTPQRACRARTGAAVQRTRDVREKGAAHRHKDGGGGIVRPSTVADRIEAIGRAPWRRVTVLRSHADLAGQDLRGALIYADPPYQGCTRYAAICPRGDVLDLCRGWADVGEVIVSEAEPLPIQGWHAVQIRGREWLTCSKPPVVTPSVQLSLWAAA